jgi:hypothetical protein
MNARFEGRDIAVADIKSSIYLLRVQKVMLDADLIAVHVVRAFVRMREVLASHKELARKLAALEQRIDSQDEAMIEILAAIR